MKAFQVVRGKLKPVSKPLPKLRRGWALIRVRLAGVCNTDIEILRGYHDFRGTPGHEFVGEVAEVRGVSAVERGRWVGRRVVGEINVSCSPLENLHPIPDSISDEQAVFVEPLAAACEILDQVTVRKFREAAVLGDGKLAQLIARVLRTELPRVEMYGKYREKLSLAHGAKIETNRVAGDESDFKRIKEHFALVVEATGSPTGLRLAQHMTEPLGTLVLKSTFHGAAPVETWPIVVKEITVVGSRCGPFAKAIALLRSGKVDPTPLISRTFPLAQAPAAIQFAQERNVMKVLLKPNSGENSGRPF